jgi:pyruvate dehydrogenase E1 component alpha subunit
MKAEATVSKRALKADKHEEAVIMPKMSVDLLLDLYTKMLRIRRFEEAAFQAYQKGQIIGFCHLYIGQEAVAVGSTSVLKKGDTVLTAYRDHAHALALGMSADSLMAELFGKATGCSKGKGGSMHFFGKDVGMLGGNGIVGSHVPVATGCAFAQKYKHSGNCTLVFFGDGAAQQGAVHEAMNIAGLWRLPIVFVVENNQYGMGTSVKRSSAVLELHQRASSYNFPGVTCDGMDVLDVREKMSAAVSMARELFTPTFVEAKTYRYRGHSMSDPAAYRTKEEVEQYQHQDPILMMKADLMKGGVDEAKFDEIEKAAKAEAKHSVEFAQNSPEPEMPELMSDVYANPWPKNQLPQVEL